MGNSASISLRDRQMAAISVRRVVDAISECPGNDCIMYAILGASLLSELGMNASAVAGSAVWRVGSGDGDVICHAMEVTGNAVMPDSGGRKKNLPAGMFHAWIEILDKDGAIEIVDFTTCMLAEKARILDAADGGFTTVSWKPAYLWGSAKKCVSLREVVNGADGGLYAYIRHPEIEAMIMPPDVQGENQPFHFAVMETYRAMQENREIQVIGIDAETAALQRNCNAA